MFEIRHEQITEEYTTRDAYNEIYSGQGILHHDSLYLWLIGLLHPVTGKTLLDIACGEGRLVTLAQRKGLNAFGTDFSIQGLYKGQHESPASSWFTADGECLPLCDGMIDYITHVGSLEHYLDPLQGAQEIARVLKPDGRACILLPNAFGLFGNVQYAMRHGDIFDDGQPLQRYGTRKAWERILNEAGLEIERVYGYSGVDWPLTTPDWKWLLSRPVKILRYLLSRLIPVNLSNNFVFLCAKRYPHGRSHS
jgi:SAM-dependent methyltransferase